MFQVGNLQVGMFQEGIKKIHIFLHTGTISGGHSYLDSNIDLLPFFTVSSLHHKSHPSANGAYITNMPNAKG